MNILLIGSGGREHALAWKLAQSEKCTNLYCAPGNAGIAEVAECVEIGVEDVKALVNFVKENDINFVVVGPEASLVAGIVNPIQDLGIPIFGPTKEAAILEGSKGFMKDLCKKYDIPTARYERFKDVEKAKEFINELGAPIVIKADGLAAGKGVIIAETVAEAEEAATDMLSGDSFGSAGAEIVVEEFMDGEEMSFFALSDGNDFVELTSAQDHKRVFDGDEGPNTGGMGAYSPAHFASAELEKKIIDRIIRPTVEGMKAEGLPFAGVLYAGLMIVNGEPKLIEYNARFGDPETQPLLMRLENDLVDLLMASATGNMKDFEGKVSFSDDVTLCVVMAAEGYPTSYEKGTEIKGLQAFQGLENVELFHAGTLKDNSGALVNSGGRVLNIVGQGATTEEAQSRAYEAIKNVAWSEGFYRTDIGWRAIAAQKKVA